MTLPDVGSLLQAASVSTTKASYERVGFVRSVEGLLMRVVGIQAAMGSLCTITSARGVRHAEVLGFDGGEHLLLPIAGLEGVAPGDAVHVVADHIEVPVGPACLGRVVDGLGEPIDGLGPILAPKRRIDAAPPMALERPVIDQALETSVPAIDGFLTLGRGQRVGIFAGSGVGKSTLLGTIARTSDIDVNVIALIGERGREVQEFLIDVLGQDGLARSVVVVATSDTPALVRVKAVMTALTIAESFRDAGRDVLLTMDSVTRFASAQREIGLAIGEPPTLRGYPPSFFASLPRIVERLGATTSGSITGLLTVLVEGDDLNEPVADTLRGLLDGHVVLDRALAKRGLYPAIDVLASVSRLMPRLVGPEDLEVARILRSCLAILEETRELRQVGAYQPGSDPLLDRAVAIRGHLESLLHGGGETVPMQAVRARMKSLVNDIGGLQ
ncbi:MAG: FliI/YscN family ATPase [Planctomycetes bacterium]|nr:FliI/YscN family ATPase [Planctomycetota bacterium]